MYSDETPFSGENSRIPTTIPTLPPPMLFPRGQSPQELNPSASQLPVIIQNRLKERNLQNTTEDLDKFRKSHKQEKNLLPLFGMIGSSCLFAAVYFLAKSSVAYLRLLKGGQQLEILTHNIFGEYFTRTVPLSSFYFITEPLPGTLAMPFRIKGDTSRMNYRLDCKVTGVENGDRFIDEKSLEWLFEQSRFNRPEENKVEL
eukprot:TRINITY_DN13435_c0_g1_i14.p1 TRINITY_DN13435_c0_g1~~TRINITY_DN13435_c0_g1_i14.p1  ORF type:complete len:220 (-),score=45.39 TRINITY_DN13435_c0_g1_i14:76-678(-)